MALKLSKDARNFLQNRLKENGFVEKNNIGQNKAVTENSPQKKTTAPYDTRPALPQVKSAVGDVKRFVQNTDIKKDNNTLKSASVPVKDVSGNLATKTRDMSKDTLASGSEFAENKRNNDIAKFFDAFENTPKKVGKSLAYLGENILLHLDNATKGTANIIDTGFNFLHRAELNFFNDLAKEQMKLKGKVSERVTKAIEENEYHIDLNNERIKNSVSGNQEELNKLNSKYKDVPENVRNAFNFVGEAAEMTPNVLLSVANPAMGTAYIAASAYSNSYGEALNDGATTQEASNYALASAALEVALEKLGGNKLFGGKTLTDSLTDKFVKRVAKNKLAQKTIRFIAESSEEGIEEVLSTALQPLIKKFAYSGTYDAPDFDEYVNSFFGGMIGSAVWSGAAAATNKISDLSRKPTTEVHIPAKQNIDIKTPPSTEIAKNGTVKATDVNSAIERIVNGTATNKDIDLFKPANAQNRAMFEEATGVKLPSTNSEVRHYLRDYAQNQAVVTANTETDTSTMPNIESVPNAQNNVDMHNVNSAPTLEVQDAQIYNIATSNLIRRARENNLDLQTFYAETENVNAYNLTEQDIQTINNAFAKMFGNNVDENIQGNLNILSKIANKYPVNVISPQQTEVTAEGQNITLNNPLQNNLNNSNNNDIINIIGGMNDVRTDSNSSGQERGTIESASKQSTPIPEWRQFGNKRINEFVRISNEQYGSKEIYGGNGEKITYTSSAGNTQKSDAEILVRNEGKKCGVDVEYATDLTVTLKDGKIVRPLAFSDGNKVVLSDRATFKDAAHEFSHEIKRKNPQKYETVKTYIKNNMDTGLYGFMLEDYINEYSEIYGFDKNNLTESQLDIIEEELICDIAAYNKIGANTTMPNEAEFTEVVNEYYNGNSSDYVKDLVVIHNMSENQLLETLKRNAFLAPSSAITNKGHVGFGDISVVFKKETIDPRLNTQNKVYGSDAWTPTQLNLKINPKFDVVKTDNTVKNIKSIIGPGWQQIFNVTSNEFKNSIKSLQGSVYGAYAENIGVQTAFAIDKGIIENVPIQNDKINVEALTNILDESLNKDSVWREYKNWLEDISNNIITSYDEATTQQILDNMNLQPDTAKIFNVSKNGELTVPATPYKSIDEIRKNKNRLSENAENEAKVVGNQFVSWANNISNKLGVNINDVIASINFSFNNRYDVLDIINSFKRNGISLNQTDAKTLQNLYKTAVELPAPYFEGKSQRLVELNEIAYIVLPNDASNELKSELSKKGISFVEYESGNQRQRNDIVNSFEDVKFSVKNSDTDYLKAVESGDMETAQRMVDEAAKSAGFTPVTRYHQTGKKFNIFSNKNPDAGLNDSDTPNGYFFKKNNHDIGVGADFVKKGHGGSIQMAVYLKSDNMLYFENRDDARKWYSENIVGYRELLEKYNAHLADFEKISKETNDKMFDELIELDKSGKSTPDLEMQIVEKYDKIVDDWIENSKSYADGLRAEMRALLNKYFIEDNSGYDGIELADDGHRYIDMKREDVHTFIVFKNTQIKSADPVTYDDKGNVIPLSERFNKQDNDIRYSFDRGKKSPDYYQQKYSEYLEQYGTIEKGMQPRVNDVDVPVQSGKGQYVSKYARTMAETKVFADAMDGEFEKMVVDGTMSHEVFTNKKAENGANQRINRDDFKESVKEFETLVNAGRVNKEDIAMGQMLLNIACQNKDVELAKKLAVDLSVAATQFGQNVQAFSMLKRMSPDGQLYYLEKSVEKINREIRDKYKDIAPIEIDNKLAENLLNAKTKEEVNEAVYAIEKNIGEQIPATKMDKWNAWRYLAMLGNTRTHFRNVFGNAVFAPARGIKNVIGAGFEKALPKAERTKSLTKTKESKDFAENDWNLMADVVKGNEGKYGTRRGIEEHRKIFKTKWLEVARKFNTNALEIEDGWFLESAYKSAFAQAMTARGLSAEYLNSGTKQANEDLQRLREYAINEAQRATYRDSNAFSEMVKNIRFRKTDAISQKAADIGNVFVEGVLPFKKTPANILARGVEYSPVGLMKGISDLYQVKKGNMSAAKAIDNISAGLTGTAIVGLGAFLAHLGALVVSPDEDDEVSGYKKMLGAQNYALKIGDHTYTIDWMSPTAMPLFVGAEIIGAFKNTENFNFKTVTDALTRISEPAFELSCLSGIQGALDSIKYADGSIVDDLLVDMALSYATQALPTLGGQIARTVDNTQRNSYHKDKNSKLPEAIEGLINKTASKIPGATFLLPEKIDRWGRVQKYGSLPERVLENFVSPGYYSNDKSTFTDKKLTDLYEKTGDKSVLPDVATKSFKVDGDMKYMSADEYVEYSKERGSLSYEYITSFLNELGTSTLDDSLKVDVVNGLYKYANAKAKEKVSDYILDKQYAKVDEAKKAGISPDKYFVAYYCSKGKESDKTASGKTIPNSATRKEFKEIKKNVTGLSEAQKIKLLKIMGYSDNQIKMFKYNLPN